MTKKSNLKKNKDRVNHKKKSVTKSNSKLAILVVSVILIILCLSAFFYFKTNTDPQNDPLELTQDDLIEINEKLVKEVEKNDIEVLDSEVDDFINEGLSISNISKEDFEEQLSSVNLTIDEYKDQLKEQIAISKLIEENVDIESVTVTKKEVNDLFEKEMSDVEDLFEDDEYAKEMILQRLEFEIKQQKQQKLILEYVESLD